MAAVDERIARLELELGRLRADQGIRFKALLGEGLLLRARSDSAIAALCRRIVAEEMPPAIRSQFAEWVDNSIGSSSVRELLLVQFAGNPDPSAVKAVEALGFRWENMIGGWVGDGCFDDVAALVEPSKGKVSRCP